MEALGTKGLGSSKALGSDVDDVGGSWDQSSANVSAFWSNL